MTELVELYIRTKSYVIKAEELDPESKSNIAVFKEQRDALDHLMRGLAFVLDDGGPEKPGYFDGQIEKARGHLFRAAYDSLDGMAASSKLRIRDVMKGASNDAIHDVFPDYYKRLVEMDEVELQIAQHRLQKDIGDGTLENLTNYEGQIGKLYGFVNQCRARAAAFSEWQSKNWKKLFAEKVVLAVIAGIVLALTLHWLCLK